MKNMNEHKSGFVSIVGRPNVGKSTLLNRIVGQKIAIMSDKAQTTRNKIQGIYTTPESQIVFIDTPGIHKPKHRLGDFMVDSAFSAFREVDVILFMVNIAEKRGPGDNFIMERLKTVKSPVFLVLNKIDKIHPDQLLPIIEDYRSLVDFEQVIPISAADGNNVETLLSEVTKYLPEGPQFYPDDQVTDHPEYFIVSELIREKVLELTREEVPHSVAVVVESMQRNELGKVQVHAAIIVERSSQKGIIIGHKGGALKKVGMQSREDLEKFFGKQIHIELYVKVNKDWRNSAYQLKRFGYNNK